MSKYKVGDKIRFVGSSYVHTVGRVYEVTGTYKFDGQTRYVTTCDKNRNFNNHRADEIYLDENFELVKEARNGNN